MRNNPFCEGPFEAKWLLSFFLGCSLAMSPLAGGGNKPWGIALRQGFLIIALVLGVFSGAFDKRFGKGKLGVEVPLLLFFVACFISWLTSGYELSSRLEVAELVLFTGLFFCVAWGLEAQQVGKIVWAALLVGAAYAFLAMYQKLALGQSRTASTFFNPNFAASFFLGALGYALGLLSGPASSKLRKWLILGSIGILVAGVWSTGSRSGLAGLVLVPGVWIWATTRKARWALVGAAVLVAALIIFPNPARDRLSKGISKDPYAFDRIKIWEQTLKIIRDHPLMGVGIGNFEYSTQGYRFPLEREVGRFGRMYRDAHNSYLQVAAELGLPGAICLLATILIIFLRIRSLLSLFAEPQQVKQNHHSSLEPQGRHPGPCQQPGMYSVSAGAGVGPQAAVARAHVISALLALVAVMSQAFFHEIVDSPPSVFLAVLAAGIVGYYWRACARQAKETQSNNSKFVPNTSKPSKSILALVTLFLVLVFWPHFSLRVFLADMVFKKAEQAVPVLGVQAAEGLLRDAIRLNPAQAYFHKTLGDLLVEEFEKKGKLEYLQEAEEEFEKAASLNRMDPHLVFHLGQFYSYVSLRGIAGKEAQDQSLEAYRKAVQMSPFNVHYLARLVLEELRRGNLAQAEAAAAKAVELEPRFLTGLFLVAQVHEAMGNPLEAKRWRERMIGARVETNTWIPLNAYEKFLIMEPEVYFQQQLFAGVFGEKRP